jgi:pimeloyl-ACP methyl ester carboxylesterase
LRTFTAELPGGPLHVYEWGEADATAILYWDGLGGTGLHANEIGPLLAQRGFRIIAPDPPGHGLSPALPAAAYRSSGMAAVAAQLLTEFDIPRATFLGFSWGGRVACAFAAAYPERTAALVLVEGGVFELPRPDDLAARIAEAREEREEESFDTWEDFFAFESEGLRRWTDEVREAHRAIMREENGRVVPIASAEVVGAIAHGGRVEQAADTHAAIAQARIPVLLVLAQRPDVDEPVARFRATVPQARVEAIPDAIHDLISFAPERVAELVAEFATG